jgi:hypothetical protein
MNRLDDKPLVKAVKVRRGLYELRGVICSVPRYRGAAPCGGQVFAEWLGPQRDGGETIPASWECFCEKCKDCDPNGWGTLAECVREAPGFWMKVRA